MAFICSVCGKEHDALPRDMAYELPADYFEIPPSERRERVWLDAEKNPDLCVIDGSRFYLRGVLAVPVKGESGDEFRWGTWAEVEEKNLRRYYELWNETDVSNEPTFPGFLSGGIRDFEGSDGLEVVVELQSNKQRPHLTVVSETHPLGIVQRDGVTLEDVHNFILLPSST
jgi:hypothetical protein